MYGHADLDVLVRRHPGWAGVGQFDRALARLRAATRPPQGLPPDSALGTLPALNVDVTAAPTLALDSERRRLSLIEQEQVRQLRARRAVNRQRQIAQERETWEREAQVAYARAVAAAQATYARRLASLVAEHDARRVNLLLQIRALQRLVLGWNDAKPPTPALNQARADLAQKQAELATLDAGQGSSLRAAQAARDAAIADAARERTGSVRAQALREETALRAQDEGQVAAFQARLSAQRIALLREARSLKSSAVAAAGPLGQQALSPDPSLAAGSPAETNLRAAESQLRAQRTRWIAFLYDDTRAAALDAAGQRRWIITFGPGRLGETDLTAPLAQALTTSVWKG